MEFVAFLAIVLLMFAMPALIWVFVQFDLWGGWNRVAQHKCGYVDPFGIPERVCPRCGEEDKIWTRRVARWDFGWKFKEPRP